MNDDDIIRLAREAEKFADSFCNGIGDIGQHHWFDAYNERFAALVAAAEREACARICEDAAQRWRDAGFDDYSMLLKDAAHQLRLRNPP